MEAVAGRSRDEGPGAKRNGAGERGDLLAQVAALACRVVEVEEAVIFLRAGGGRLREIARSGRARPRRGAGARCPLVVDGEERGLLTVSSRRPLTSAQLELVGELADLAASSLEERELRVRAE